MSRKLAEKLALALIRAQRTSGADTKTHKIYVDAIEGILVTYSGVMGKKAIRAWREATSMTPFPKEDQEIQS